MVFSEEKYLFHRGWRRLLDNIIFNITGLELLDGMSSRQKRGVYIILSIDHITQTVDVEYIGSSCDMRKRLFSSKHEVYDVLYKRQDHYNWSCPIYYIDTNKYEDVEKILIKSLRPRMNKQHNSQKKISSAQKIII